MKIAQIYSRMLGRFSKRTFPLWQALGFYVIPNHYYEPIPDTRKIPEKLWDKQSELVGIDMRDKEQLSLLSSFVTNFKEEYERFPRTKTDDPLQYYIHNGAFESVDGEILYCMIRHFKPRRIFEIGSGNSTLLAAQAVRHNTELGSACKLVAIDPYAKPVLTRLSPGLSQVLPVAVQDVPVEYFAQLSENDILFIDSSHVLKLGSDVQYEFLEILPRLKPGVVVHIHDIFMPAEYRKDWVLRDHRFFNEQYLLQAFLAFNNTFVVLWAGSYMHLKHPDKLEGAFRSYDPTTTWPGSFWIQRVK